MLLPITACYTAHDTRVDPHRTGYTWDPDLFPRPAETLERLHDAGLSVAANLHDYDGIGCWEDTRDAVAKAMGLPTISPCTKAIQFDLTNKSCNHAGLKPMSCILPCLLTFASRSRSH